MKDFTELEGKEIIIHYPEVPERIMGRSSKRDSESQEKIDFIYSTVLESKSKSKRTDGR